MRCLSLFILLVLISFGGNSENAHLQLEKVDDHFYTYLETDFELRKDGVVVDPLNYQVNLKGNAKYFRFDSHLRIIAFDTKKIQLTIKTRGSGEKLNTFKIYPKPNPYIARSWDTLEACESPSIATKEAYFTYQNYSNFKMLGDTIPKVNLQTFEGKEVDKESFLGKTTFINFWKYGCLPCIEEIPALNKLKKKFKGNDQIRFISFFTDSIFRKSGKQKIYEFNGLSTVDSGRAQPFKIDFNFTQVPNTEPVHEKFGVCGYPTNMIIDEKGVIRDIKVGAPMDTSYNKYLIRYFKRRIKEVERN